MASSQIAPPFHSPVLGSDGRKISRDWYVWIQQVSAATGGTDPQPSLSPLEINDLYLTDRRR